LFELPTAATRAALERKIRVHFARFERDHRARLSSVEIAQGQNGTLEALIAYHDVNADRPVALPVVFPGR
jgi:hypothetical protein